MLVICPTKCVVAANEAVSCPVAIAHGDKTDLLPVEGFRCLDWRMAFCRRSGLLRVIHFRNKAWRFTGVNISLTLITTSVNPTPKFVTYDYASFPAR
jgi:hypothetical protein